MVWEPTNGENHNHHHHHFDNLVNEKQSKSLKDDITPASSWLFVKQTGVNEFFWL